MFFLNLTAAQFFVLFGTLAALVTTLYLLDRVKRKRVVSTLRFWVAALSAEERQSRKRMREPWSFALQIIGLLLLLLALAQLQWGLRRPQGRDSVLLLDTSAWSAEGIGSDTLLNREKAAAREYVARRNVSDRIMLVRADALAAPATAFTADAPALDRAIDESVPGSSSLNLEQALRFALQARAGSGHPPGEIVYIGPGLIDAALTTHQAIPNLRVIPVNASRENCGIRGITAKPRDGEPGTWDALITLKNYAARPRRVRLDVRFAGTAFVPRSLSIPGNREATVAYSFETNTAGLFAATLQPHDTLAADDRAEVWLPQNRALKIAVFTGRPDLLTPLLAANRRVSATVASPSAYTPRPAADIMLLDQMSPPSPPQIPSLWIDPPSAGSPVPVKTAVTDTRIRAWDSSRLLGAALYTKDAQLPSANVFETFKGDLVLGSVQQGPVVIARPHNNTHPQLALIGFDPFTADLRFQVTTPLLFADLLRWLSPQAFRATDVSAHKAGSLTIPLDPGERSDHIHVTDTAGAAVPFTIRDHAVQLFAARPGIIHIASEDHDRMVSLTLPDVADEEWKPANAQRGLPPHARVLPSPVDLWKWLALAAACILVIEWTLYGRRRALRATSSGIRSGADSAENARELVHR